MNNDNDLNLYSMTKLSGWLLLDRSHVDGEENARKFRILKIFIVRLFSSLNFDLYRHFSNSVN